MTDEEFHDKLNKVELAVRSSKWWSILVVIVVSIMTTIVGFAFDTLLDMKDDFNRHLLDARDMKKDIEYLQKNNIKE